MAMKKNKIAKIVAGFLVGCSVLGAGNVAFATKTAKAAASVYDTWVDTYVSQDVQMKNAPSVVCDVASQSVLDALKTAVANDTVRPANAIVRLNDSGKVVDKAGAELGDFQTVFESAFAGKIIPVVQVETEAAANALIAFLTDTLDILDMAVISATPALVKKVCEAKPTVRGIIAYASDAELGEIVKSANTNLANTVTLPASKATAKNVRYLQTRMKSVWVTAESTEKMHVNDCIQSGAYGVVAEDFQALYTAYATYGESLCRMPINISYQSTKGLLHNENSKIGVEKSMEGGSDIVHLDARLSKDNEIVLMYDETIDRTSNGTGNIADYTLEELQEFELDLLDYEKEPIPALADVIPVVEEKNSVVWIKLQVEGAEMVTALSELIEEYDCAENVIVQASDTCIEQINAAIPEISTIIETSISLSLKKSSDPNVVFTEAEQKVHLTQTLNTKLAALFTKTSKCRSNVLLSVSEPSSVKIGITEMAQRYLKDRGILRISSSGLTTDANYNLRTQEGIFGLLGKYAALYQKREMIVNGKDDTRPTLAVGDNVPVTVTTYNGSTNEAVGKVFALEDKGDSWIVVAVYEGKTKMPLYTQSYTITKGEKTTTEETNKDTSANTPDETPKENNNMVWIIVGIAGAVVVIGAVVAIVIIKNKKKEK